MFALLSPGARLNRHRDPYAGSLRYHLGLVTPTSEGVCRIFVDGQEYSWCDGEDFLFDETYLHYAENTTNEARIILFCDVERPLTNRIVAAVNRWVSRHIVKETATENMEGERVGTINRAFAHIYKVRLAGKRLKATHYRLYYVMKYSIYLSIPALILATVFL